MLPQQYCGRLCLRSLGRASATCVVGADAQIQRVQNTACPELQSCLLIPAQRCLAGAHGATLLVGAVTLQQVSRPLVGLAVVLFSKLHLRRSRVAVPVNQLVCCLNYDTRYGCAHHKHQAVVIGLFELNERMPGRFLSDPAAGCTFRTAGPRCWLLRKRARPRYEAESSSASINLCFSESFDWLIVGALYLSSHKAPE